MSSRRSVVLATLAAGLAALATSGATWVAATTSSAVEGEVAISVTGAQAAPGVGAGGLVLLAGGVALALGGRWGRRLAAAGIGLGGILVLASAVQALGSAQAVALTAAQEAVGVAVLTSDAVLTAAPWIAVALGVVAIVLAVYALVAGRGWAGPARRHERDRPGEQAGRRAAAPDGDPASDWDALTRGEDPTDGGPHGLR